METLSFLHRQWYLLFGLAIGLVVVAVLFGPMFKARASLSLSAREYLSPIPLIALAVGLIGGATIASALESDVLVFFFVVLLLLCVILGWALTVENDALRFADWFRFGGILQPVPERMARPVHRSWTLTALFLVVGLAAGTCIRLLILASA
jgi:hypothetical protein